MPKWLDEDKANASLLDRDDVPQPVLDIIERAHAHIEKLSRHLCMECKHSFKMTVCPSSGGCFVTRDEPPEVK